MRSEILCQRRGVVLPDRLVELGGGQNDVAGGPHGCAEQQAVADPGSLQRRGDDSVLGTVDDAERALRDVVEDWHALRWKLYAEEALDEPLADLRWRRRLIPAGEASGELPVFHVALAGSARTPARPWQRFRARLPECPGGSRPRG